MPAAPIPRPECHWITPEDPLALRLLRQRMPPAYVFTLPGARLLGSAGWIVGADDTFLFESSFWREPDHPEPFGSHRILSRKRALPLRRLPGRTLSLASDFAIGGFGHFLHDGLPRLHLAELAGHRITDFDWIYLPRIDTPSTRRLIQRLGVPAERILQHDASVDIETEELVATTYPGTPGHIPAYVPTFLRARFTTGGKAPATRRIFLSREGFRRDLAERPAVEKILRHHGFEIVRPHEVDAPALCAEAAVVVAQEGANFLNTLFCPPGAHLLMLWPNYLNLPYAFTQAAAAGHELWVQNTPLTTPSPQGPLSLDLDLFTRALDRLLS